MKTDFNETKFSHVVSIIGCDSSVSSIVVKLASLKFNPMKILKIIFSLFALLTIALCYPNAYQRGKRISAKSKNTKS